jgi:VanZ family protein
MSLRAPPPLLSLNFSAMSKPWIRVALALVVGAILVVTLFPNLGEETPTHPWCYVCGERGVAHILLNLILFAPYGALLTLAGVPRRWTWLSGCLFSACIEFAQRFIPGRDSGLDDVLSNTTGTIVGSLIAVAAVAWLRRPGRPSVLGALAAAAAVLLVVAATGLLLRPSFPRGVAYDVQWSPDSDVRYRTWTVKAELGGMVIPSTRLSNTAHVRDLLLAGAPLYVRAVAGPPLPPLAPLFRIADSTDREILLFALLRDDFVLRYRTRAAAWRLDQPNLRVPGIAHSRTRGDTLDLAMWRQGRGVRSQLCLRYNDAQACGLGFTAGRGWAVLMYPPSLPEWLYRVVDLGWIGGLLSLVGFLSRGDRAALLVAGVISLLGLAALPALVGLLATPPLEWEVAVAGLLAGAVVSARFARRIRTSAAPPPLSSPTT